MTSRNLKYLNVALPANLLRAIGHVAAIWGQMEYSIDSTIRHALEWPNAKPIRTTLARPFDQRIDLLEDLLPLFLPETEIDKWGLKALTTIKNLHPQRNLIVHGAVGSSRQRRGNNQNVYWFRRIRWDRPAYIAEKRALTVFQVEAIATKISQQIAWAALLGDYARRAP